MGDKIVGDSTDNLAQHGEGSREPARELDRDGFLEVILEPGRVDGRSLAVVRTGVICGPLFDVELVVLLRPRRVKDAIP